MALGLSLLVFYVTSNDISVIYVTARMCGVSESPYEKGCPVTV